MVKNTIVFGGGSHSIPRNPFKIAYEVDCGWNKNGIKRMHKKDYQNDFNDA